MSPHLESTLYARFPALFSERALPLAESLMSWGICCGDGWYALIDTLCVQIESAVEAGVMPPVRFKQIKEKSGFLRIHFSGGNDATRSLVEEVCARACFVCEDCGGVGTCSPRAGNCSQSSIE